MKKIIFTLILCSTFITKAQFKSVEWGASKDIVVKKYGDPITSTDEFVVYEFDLAGDDVYGYFYFLKDKLYRGGYLLNENHTNKTEYLNYYGKYKTLLTKKYGQPINDEVVWLDDLYKDSSSDWGLAASIGHLVMYSSWNDGKTKIECSISGDNYKVTVKIIYESIELENWSKTINEEKKLDDF